MSEQFPQALPIALYDRTLLTTVGILLVFGLLMVASTSIVIAQKKFGQPFYFFFRHLSYIGIGLMTGLFVFKFISIRTLQNNSFIILFTGLLLLVLVLIPGIGKQIHGSMRWIKLGPLNIQASEFSKIALIIYLSDYLVRHRIEVLTRIRGFLRPLFLIGFLLILLLCEPDFGSVTVILCTSLGLLFLAGVRWWQFSILLLGGISSLIILAFISPYRVQRLTSFLNPWLKQYESGYQLTQSLIAFGRGGWLGVGLGESIQKLLYLPEAHTDFIFAVLTEELGALGGIVLITLFAIVIVRGLKIGYCAYFNGRIFAAYLAYGISLALALQIIINMGVNMGLFPTKGLTLPFISFGGSSLLVVCIMIAILLRIDYERVINSYGL